MFFKKLDKTAGSLSHCVSMVSNTKNKIILISR